MIKIHSSLKIVIGMTMVLAMIMPLSTVNYQALASTGFDGDDFSAYKPSRSPINPQFDPDYSCLFDVYQIQCIPGSQQECPENFGNNDDSTCFPLDENGDWVCPDGYHNEDGDETGQCYPNDEGCLNDNGFVLLTDIQGESDRCADLDYVCNEDEHIKEDYCIEYCDSNPERQVCKPESN